MAMWMALPVMRWTLIQRHWNILYAACDWSW